MPKAKTRDVFERHRDRTRILWRELAKLPSVDLTGIVRPKGVGGGKSQGDKKWTLQIPLIAWRIGRGPIELSELTVRKLVGERAVQQFMDRLKDYDIIAMRARVSTTNIFGSPQAQLVRFIGRKRDADLMRAVKQLQLPVRVKDPRFGMFTLDRVSGDFDGKARWAGKSTKLSLSLYQRESPDDSLRQARKLFQSERKWVPLIQHKILAELLPLYDQWREQSGDPPLTPQQFMRRLRLETISVQPDGDFSFWYDDGDLFYGHAVVARGNLTKGMKDASIEG